MVRGFRCLFPRWFFNEKPTKKLELAARLFVRLGYAFFMTHSFKTVWAAFTGLELSERFPPSAALAFSQTIVEGTLGQFGQLSRALTYLDRSFQLMREFNDLWGMANSLLLRGAVLFSVGRFGESKARLEEARSLYHQAGDQWEINASCLLWMCCQIPMGNLSEGMELGRQKFEEGVRMGDDNTCHYGLSGWSMAVRGNLPFGELKKLFPPLPDNIIATSMLLMAEGSWHAFHSRTGEALQTFETAFRMVQRNLAINTMTAPALTGLVTALRRHARTLDQSNPDQAQRLRRRAFRLAHGAVWMSRVFPHQTAPALRELSHAYAAKGRLRKALHLAEKSCAVAEAQEARFEYAQSALVRGRLGRRLKLPWAEEQIHTAETALASFHNEAIQGRS